MLVLSYFKCVTIGSLLPFFDVIIIKYKLLSVLDMKMYLAPLQTVGNHAFRSLCLHHGADYVFCEMSWCHKLLAGDKYELEHIKIIEGDEDKTGVQLIAKDEKDIPATVAMLKKKYPQLKEIVYNIGCPDSQLAKKKLGGAMMGDLKKLFEHCETLEIACCEHKILPSVKIRLGPHIHETNVVDTVCMVHQAGIKKVYIHGRRTGEGYQVPARYDEMLYVKKRMPVRVIGNGSIRSVADIEQLSRVDGVMLGTAALIDVRIFSFLKEKKDLPVATMKDRLQLISEFVDIASTSSLSLDKAKKNISWMTKEVPKASAFRAAVNDAKSYEEIYSIIASCLAK